MTKQELINTYDSMSMPEEHVEAIEARLKKLYDNPSPSSAPEVPEESTREYKFDRKKPSAVKAAVISISAAAAVLLVFGGRYLINGLPISSDPPLDAETEETSEPPYDTEEIRFESADDIPGYERAGCYDEYEHSLIPGADSGKAGPLFTQRLRDGKPVSVVRIKITSANSWDEMNYTEYHAVITECLSGKQLNLNISNEVTFRLGSTHSEQIIGEPSLAAGTTFRTLRNPLLNPKSCCSSVSRSKDGISRRSGIGIGSTLRITPLTISTEISAVSLL